jgi:acetyl-CoA C-acetyltransferase
MPDTPTKPKVTRRIATRGRPVYIVDGGRTPQLRANEKPGPFSAADLAVTVGRALLTRQPFEPGILDEVILGCVMPGPDETNIGRIVALRIGCGKHVLAWTVQHNCASGMQALDSAAKDIRLGRANLVLAGGVEAMSHAPVFLNQQMVAWLGSWMAAKTWTSRAITLTQLRPQFLKPVFGLLRGLTDPVVGLNMGQTAEVLAHRFGITRSEMDAFALRSHQRLAVAQDNNYLSEIEPLYDRQGNYYLHDDGLRRNSTLEQLADLRPVFDIPYGKITAGNSAQVTDGAAMLLLASDKAVEKYNLRVVGQIIDSEWVGLEPAQMGLGPVQAATPLLKRNKLKLQDVEFWEINEAFAAQVLACLKAWQNKDYCKSELGLASALGELDQSRLNVDGGGVSLGHPVGASGARIVLHLLHVLQRHNASTGIATMCIGGGQGGAMLIKRTTET